MDLSFWVQAIVMIAFIFLGVRAGGVGLGAWGAAGTLVLVFVFGLPPGAPPTSAILVIISVITAASVMQAAGGIEYLVKIAKGILESRPSAIVYVAPPVSFIFTVLAGTSNIFYPLIPVIYKLCYQNGIRPEKALGPSTVASAFGITASPVSAAMAAMITLTAVGGYELSQVLLITLPASLIAIVVFSFVSSKLGKDLKDDPEYIRRLAAGEVQPPETEEEEEAPLPASAQISALLFLTGVLFIVAYGLFKEPILAFYAGFGYTFGDAPPDSTTMIQMVMLTVAAIMLVVTKVSVADVPKQQMFGAGMVAMIALFGLAWLADTFIAANEAIIVDTMQGIIEIVTARYRPDCARRRDLHRRRVNNQPVGHNANDHSDRYRARSPDAVPDRDVAGRRCGPVPARQRHSAGGNQHRRDGQHQDRQVRHQPLIPAIAAGWRRRLGHRRHRHRSAAVRYHNGTAGLTVQDVR